MWLSFISSDKLKGRWQEQRRRADRQTDRPFLSVTIYLKAIIQIAYELITGLLIADISSN